MRRGRRPPFPTVGREAVQVMTPATTLAMSRQKVAAWSSQSD